MHSTAALLSKFEAGDYDATLAELRSIESSRPLAVFEQLIHAELLHLTGEPAAAVHVAAQVLSGRQLSAKQRCRLQGILGHAHFQQGDNYRGTEHLRIAIQLAANSEEATEEARLRLDLFANQVRWLGPSLATENIEALRRKIHSVGDPTLNQLLHITLAELAAKSALMPQAHKHLEIARSLLPAVCNQALHASFHQIEIALLAQQGDYAAAYRRGIELVQDSQISVMQRSLPTLLAHVSIMHGRFDEAERWLERGIHEGKLKGGNALALQETLIALRFRQGRLDEALALGASCDALISATGCAGSYFELWYQLTKVKLMYRLGRVQEGLDTALDALPRIQRMADHVLLNRMTLLAAEGYARRSEPERAARLLTAVFEHQPSFEVVAESCRVLGLIAGKERPRDAANHFTVASRIFLSLGNLIGATDVEHDRRELTLAEPASSFNSETLNCIDQVLAILDSGDHPRLLGELAGTMIEDTKCALEHQVICGEARAARPDSGAERSIGEEHRIPLGSERGQDFELRVVPNPTAHGLVTLLSIQRLVDSAVSTASARRAFREEWTYWSHDTPDRDLGIVCASKPMMDLLNTLRRVATSGATVLLTGETGVGKEVFARALHEASPRHGKTFLPFNVTTAAREIVDSQLFGHRRGSFTGANTDSPGLIKSAAGGTLFLDEIGEMPLDAQPKLLRFLESGEILPLGQGRTEHVDVRIVAATNANLEELIATGRFREDLYYRLNVLRLHIPPLRERREEIPALVEHFLNRFSRELHKTIPRVAEETLEYLVLYRWPGNVRQLSNEIRRMVTLAESGSVLMPAHLSTEIAASRRTVPVDQQAAKPVELMTRIDQPLAATLEHVERAAIQRALAVSEGRVEDAAKLLGLSRKGLYLKRQRLKIHDEGLPR